MSLLWNSIIATCKIHPIHEGATAAHGQDLLGRKMTAEKGKAAKIYYQAVEKTIREAMADSDLKIFAQDMEKALYKLEQVTEYLFGLAAQGNVVSFLADATLYLEFFGIITIGWQWLMQAIAARKALKRPEAPVDEGDFYEGKLYVCRYFFIYELPKIESLAITLTKGTSLTVDIKNDYFEE